MTRRPQSPVQTDTAASSHRTSCQVRGFGADDPTPGITVALQVDESYVLDGSVAWDGPEDAVGWGLVIGV